ncbi:anthranilate synthase component I family protein [Tunturibacter gelidoferens]|uniref:Anthranilate synthase component 1 n=2 Tax=Tunturiibacter gelidiferens TaxID=3069689 RepID=A0AAU7Z7A0_9BACT
MDEAMPSFDSSSLPSAREFLKLSRKHSLVPVYRTVTADLETPVSAFLRIASEEPEAFLLESVEGGEHVGRYTFIGIQPYKRMVARGTRITVREGRRESTFDGDIFEELKKALSGHTPARLPGLPPFTAGAVGFFAYDVVRQIEKLPTLAKDELGVPDACLMFFDQVLAFDHVKKEIHLMVTADLTREAREGAYERAVRRLNKMERRLAEALPVRRKKKPEGKLKITSRTPKAAFLKAVEKTKEYIASGDVFQCVLSQRFDCVPGVDAFEVYRALRIVNPSPYMYFLRFGLEEKTKSKTQILRSAKDDNKKGEFADKRNNFAKDSSKKNKTVAHIVGSSPELLVRVHGREVEYRPIAGTRPRGADEVKDRAMEADLRADEKEVAEHIMLVDLGRNDVGRVSEFGSVKVKDLMFVERYSHVMHMVSSLEGKLKAGLGALDAFRACFPAGTLSGAPKIRAMEILEELEPARRGVYGGSVLYADFSGNLDSCIAIRTLYMNGEQGHFQAGAGIVADSVPEKEFEECGNKARAVVRAIERARSV